MRELFLLLGLFVAVKSEAALHRSSAARTQFSHQITCPSTHANRLPCPGYVIDHKIPLCAGGPDAPANMQWEEYRESKRKDKEEVYWCHLIDERLMPSYRFGENPCAILEGKDMPLLRRSLCP